MKKLKKFLFVVLLIATLYISIKKFFKLETENKVYHGLFVQKKIEKKIEGVYGCLYKAI